MTKDKEAIILVPLRQWKAYQRKLRKFKQITQIEKDLREAFKEMDEVRRGKRKGKTMSEFLKETIVREELWQNST